MLPPEVSNSIPEDIRGDANLANINDVGTLAKNYVETKSLVGRSIQLPNKDAKPEDYEKWQGEAVGKLKDHGFTLTKVTDAPPDSPDKYKFEIDGVTPEQMAEDKILVGFTKTAHEAGINQQGASRLLDWYLREAIPQLKEGAEKIDMVEDPQQVEKILGERFKGEAGTRREEFNRAVNALSPAIPDLKDFLEGTAPHGKSWMANKDHPAMVQLLSEVARLQSQDFGGHVQSNGSGAGIDQLDNEIDSVRKNTRLTDEQQADRLEALYKRKAALIGAK